MASPSSLPSARQVAMDCFPKYEQAIGTSLPPVAREDLEAQSKFAFDRGELQKLFLAKLVVWRPFFRNPNKGHAAVADVLATGAVRSAITTNFDFLVEQAAEQLGEDVFLSALDGVEAVAIRPHQPYVKIHGCARRDPDNTLWCKEQITPGSPLQLRIESCKTWLRANLVAKDLVLVGFWSDWDYLIDIFEHCIIGIEPRLVVVVDPQSTANLQTKAPALWAWATNGDQEFRHAQESGADFLEELRRRISFQILEGVINGAKTAYEVLTGKSYARGSTFDATLSTDELYSLRRDIEGKPPTSIARAKSPTSAMQLIGTIQMRLVEAGATFEGARFVLNSKRIRVLQGAGEVLSLIKKKFEAEQSPLAADVVICVGAREDGGAPASIVRGASALTIIKPATASNWLTDEQAVLDLAI
ncbi:MAG: hypothetical protein QOG67_183 [Verrucomicrobiota bacterium]